MSRLFFYFSMAITPNCTLGKRNCWPPSWKFQIFWLEDHLSDNRWDFNPLFKAKHKQPERYRKLRHNNCMNEFTYLHHCSWYQRTHSIICFSIDSVIMERQKGLRKQLSDFAFEKFLSRDLHVGWPESNVLCVAITFYTGVDWTVTRGADGAEWCF